MLLSNHAHKKQITTIITLVFFVFVVALIAFVFTKETKANSNWGIFESDVIDFGITVDPLNISWTANVPPTSGPNCDTVTGAGCAIAIQVAASNCSNGASNAPLCDSGTWQYIGPNGPSTFFTTQNQLIHSSLNGNRYFRYQMLLYTEDPAVSPEVTGVSISYAQFPSSTSLESSEYDSNILFNSMESVSWVENNVTATEDVKLQISTSADRVVWSPWYGPTSTTDFFDYTDGTNGCTKSGFVVTCSTMPIELSTGGDDRFFKYKVTIVSSGSTGLASPSVSNVDIRFNDEKSSNFVSNTIDFGLPVTISKLSWTATGVDSNTQASCDTSLGAGSGNGCAVKFKIAANNDNATWNYVGPDGSPDTYFTISGQSIPTSLIDNRYFRYRLFLSSINPTLYSPAVSNVLLTCVSCTQSAYVESSPFNTNIATASMENVQFSNNNPDNLNGAIKFLFRTAPDGGGWPAWGSGTGWMGPDGIEVLAGQDPTSYFTKPSDYFPSIMRDGVDDQWFQYRAYFSQDIGGVPDISNIAVSYYPFGLNSTITQSAYRIFEESNSTTVFSPIDQQDTQITLASDNQAFRLRMLLHVAGADLPVIADNFKLQFSAKSGQCDTAFVGENYIDVTNTSAIAFYDNLDASAVDGVALTQNATSDPTHLSDASIPQSYEESNNTSTINGVSVGSDGIWDFSLYDNTAPTNVSYCFRVVRSNGAALDVYDVVPRVNTRVSLNTNFFFNQIDWLGGISVVGFAVHPGDQSFWDKYFSASPDLIIGSDITVSDSSSSIIQNSSSVSSPYFFDADTTNTGTEVSGGGVRLQSGF